MFVSTNSFLKQLLLERLYSVLNVCRPYSYVTTKAHKRLKTIRLNFSKWCHFLYKIIKTRFHKFINIMDKPNLAQKKVLRKSKYIVSFYISSTYMLNKRKDKSHKHCNTTLQVLQKAYTPVVTSCLVLGNSYKCAIYFYTCRTCSVCDTARRNQIFIYAITLIYHHRQSFPTLFSRF